MQSSRAASETAESIQYRAVRHLQGWSERKQVFIISCEVEGVFFVSNWILTCAAYRDYSNVAYPYP